MAITAIASAAVSAVGTISAGKAQADAAEFNAQIAQQQAERERQIAEREAADFRRREGRVLAASRARRAGSGVTSQGSPLLVDEVTAAEIELGAQNILVGGATSATRLQQQAALDRSRARSAKTGAFLDAGSTLLTTAGQTNFNNFFEPET
ncbi:hypothetical protein HBA54_00015 [Pelagibius litoralis]|uniref:Uncharacterized protein n=1 Tax=Pelagibius litoralis TaxID=374515 RepID=A0A967C4B6_9PROT|nr:hypothetical protein [Pelagibius litoralis]NIA66971.1 hypothetical protein [Pelagibius litoralis]